ncbi:hypothetical protein V7968_02575 [Nocardia vulneris]|uniref:hypothetical protein n=1 Tax=Nocardia vulneris TaxID=1141657 RepID=UPI0030D02C26
MPNHTNRPHSITHANVDTDASAEGQSHNITPLHRPKRQPGIGIERVETEQMTPDEYNRAVAALASLINQWKSHTTPQQPNGEIAA